jgi:hypothetical protein
MRVVVLSCLTLGLGCQYDGSADPQKKPAEGTHKLAGVYPENWKCDSVATVDALQNVLGGTIKVIDTPVSPPRGAPHPCNYELDANPPEYWTFDIDCRDGYKQRADALFEQYKRTSAELVDRYNSVSDAGPKHGSGGGGGKGSAQVDAGPPPRAPEPASDVQVGSKGLDHHGQGLIFIDDDAPCYVRVVGPDAGHRFELAKMLAKNLTFANAPMNPRPFP